MEENKGRNRLRRTRDGRENVRINKSEETFLENTNEAEAVSAVEDIVKINNETINSIGQSGNSDVDIQVEVKVETTAIAFALLCSLLATKQMNNEEFDEAVRRLEGLTRKKDFLFTKEAENDVSQVRIFNKNLRRRH